MQTPLFLSGVAIVNHPRVTGRSHRSAQGRDHRGGKFLPPLIEYLTHNSLFAACVGMLALMVLRGLLHG